MIDTAMLALAVLVVDHFLNQGALLGVHGLHAVASACLAAITSAAYCDRVR